MFKDCRLRNVAFCSLTAFTTRLVAFTFVAIASHYTPRHLAICSERREDGVSFFFVDYVLWWMFDGGENGRKGVGREGMMVVGYGKVKEGRNEWKKSTT